MAQTESAMNAQLNTGMQPVQFENPMGVDGFQFVEFAAPDATLLHDMFRKLGFVAVARHKTKAITVYRQGACDFLRFCRPYRRGIGKVDGDGIRIIRSVEIGKWTI